MSKSATSRKAPARREYNPKPMDPGQRIQWVKITQAHWEGRVFGGGGWSATLISPGTWVEEVREVRTGIVWSVAATPSQWWVQPDDSPSRPVLVQRQGKKFAHGLKEGDLYEIPGAGEAARNAVLRGEHVRKVGIYAVVEHVFTERSWGVARGDKRTYVKWHCAEDCQHAKGKERFNRAEHGFAYGYGCGQYSDSPWTPLDVAIALTRGGQIPSELCESCIVLGTPEAMPSAA